LLASQTIITTTIEARDDNGAGRGWISLSHTHPQRKKFIFILILKSNGYQIFMSSSLGNEYIRVIVPTFLLFQYKLVIFYKIKKLRQRKYNVTKYLISKERYYHFFNIKYLEKNYNCICFKLEYEMKFHEN